MAGQQKAIFLRFNMEDEADSSLYMKLVETAGSVSLTSYVKRVLEEYLNVKLEMAERQQFHGRGIIVRYRYCNCTEDSREIYAGRSRITRSMWVFAG